MRRLALADNYQRQRTPGTQHCTDRAAMAARLAGWRCLLPAAEPPPGCSQPPCSRTLAGSW